MRTAPVTEYSWEEAIFFTIKKNERYERRIIFYKVDAGGLYVPAYNKTLGEHDPIYRNPTFTASDGGFTFTWLDPFSTSWIKTKERQRGNGAFGYTEETGAWRIIKVRIVRHQFIDASDRIFEEGTENEQRLRYNITWPSAPFWFSSPTIEEEVRERILAENYPQVPL